MAKCWKMVLFIKNGKVYYHDHKTNDVPYVTNMVDGNRLVLGSKGIMISIITPLQKSKDAHALTVEHVINERCQGTQLNAQEITDQFKSKEGRIEC